MASSRSFGRQQVALRIQSNLQKTPHGTAEAGDGEYRNAHGMQWTGSSPRDISLPSPAVGLRNPLHLLLKRQQGFSRLGGAAEDIFQDPTVGEDRQGSPSSIHALPQSRCHFVHTVVETVKPQGAANCPFGPRTTTRRHTQSRWNTVKATPRARVVPGEAGTGVIGKRGTPGSCR
ncbi:hypothetical protein CIHG_00747 [Coccidioides immitis H538.4]|uniref:Uncharacterized protein n=3 Tax=Coccidioides immitis TaxID=5501 RepID=A0A0J8THA0_COCIT|nr:hypothetical protein CIRG_03165 [Coccidioides immitis RMSCC 2394]KMU73062.1 hypothetical protein CISG_03323 [Coccidioides immitis RMSCC 3703]KMU82965.1 hypothetical protein CIHG_00747 [Coccidioides immitis H538.4]